ncbi:MAG: carbohydrate kinase family protein [Rhodomicrobium sp.]
MTILVVGSVLIDIIATYKENTPPYQTDITGEIDAYRIGGTAYNVAHNLLSLGCKVRLMTYLSDKSFLTNFFKKKLAKEGLLGEFVKFQNLPEGAFIAHRRGSAVERAVTCTVIQKVDIRQDVIEKAMDDITFLALDCSLSPFQISAFIKYASSKGIGVMVLGTSDSKVTHLLSASLDPNLVDILVVNKAEYRAICRNIDKLKSENLADPRKLSGDLVVEVCHATSAKNIVVTLSEDGMSVLSNRGSQLAFDAPGKGPVISTTGAGDALAAVVAAHYVKNGSFDWAQINREIRPRVLSTLLFEGATPNCEATVEDLN